jgi:hypothetical protein
MSERRVVLIARRLNTYVPSTIDKLFNKLGIVDYDGEVTVSFAVKLRSSARKVTIYKSGVIDLQYSSGCKSNVHKLLFSF